MEVKEEKCILEMRKALEFYRMRLDYFVFRLDHAIFKNYVILTISKFKLTSDKKAFPKNIRNKVYKRNSTTIEILVLAEKNFRYTRKGLFVI